MFNSVSPNTKVSPQHRYQPRPNQQYIKAVHEQAMHDGWNERQEEKSMGYGWDSGCRQHRASEKGDKVGSMAGMEQGNTGGSQKVLLWIRVMVFIYNTINGEQKLKSIKFGLSETDILNKFISQTEQLLQKTKQGQNIELRNYISCQQLLNDCKNKLADDLTKIVRLLSEIDKALKINRAQSTIWNNPNPSQQPLPPTSSLQPQNSLQTSKLTTIISALQNQLLSLKPQNPQSQTYLPIKQPKNNIQQQKNKILKTQIVKLKIENKKINKTIQLAQNINQQFINKIQIMMKKNWGEQKEWKEISQEAMFEYFGRNHKNYEETSCRKSDFHIFKKKFNLSKTKIVSQEKPSFPLKK